MQKEIELYELRRNTRMVMMEWITTICIFIACFAYLAYKIDTQSERTDKLYEMFIDLVKEKRET